MKETKSVGQYSCCDTDIDYSGVWFYELFGWHYVKTTSYRDDYVEKATYLVSDGSDRLRVESGYRSAGHGYNLKHVFEREKDDPRYAEYCALEKKLPCVFLWDGYPAVLERIKKAFPKGRPDTYARYRKRFRKFYVIGFVLLAVMGIIVALGPESLGFPHEKVFYMALAMLGIPAAICIIRGIAGQIKSFDQGKMDEAYQAYLAEMIPGVNMRNIVIEAMKLMEP